jgi:hypothetical protein
LKPILGGGGGDLNSGEGRGQAGRSDVDDSRSDNNNVNSAIWARLVVVVRTPTYGGEEAPSGRAKNGSSESRWSEWVDLGQIQSIAAEVLGCC